MGDAYLGDEVEESFPLSARVIGLLVGGSQPVVRGYFEEAVELIPDDFGCSRVIVRRAGLGSQLSEVVEIGADRPVVSELPRVVEAVERAINNVMGVRERGL